MHNVDDGRCLVESPYTMQAYNTVEAFNTGGSTCLSAILSMPTGGPGGPLADNNAFYLWKALVIELARGTAFSRHRTDIR